jgi:hypothetical protein
MVIFRWILAVLVLLLGTGMALAFAIYVGDGNREWMKRARRLRHWAYLVLLLWVNVEIWRSVLMVLIDL